MKELKCPNCGKIFKVDEADYASIVSQVRNAEFNKELDRRMADVITHKRTETELAVRKAEQDFAARLNDKELKLQETLAEASRLKDELENAEAMRRALALPPHVVPAVLLVVGRPTEQQRRRPKPRRFAPEAVVCENAYRDRTEAELRADFAARAARPDYDFDADLQAFCARKYDSDFSREMSRSAAVYLADFRFPEA